MSFKGYSGRILIVYLHFVAICKVIFQILKIVKGHSKTHIIKKMLSLLCFIYHVNKSINNLKNDRSGHHFNTISYIFRDFTSKG